MAFSWFMLQFIFSDSLNTPAFYGIGVLLSVVGETRVKAYVHNYVITVALGV